MVDRRYQKDGSPIPLGGSLHRAPNGRLCTIQTTIQTPYPSPDTAQLLWRNTSRKRYPIEWDGIEPEGALIYWWGEPFEVECGRDRHGLGFNRAYHAGREYGIIEVTSREYWSPERFSSPPTTDPLARRERTKPRYWTTATSITYARTTFCHWQCRQCGRSYERNMARIGRAQFDSPENPYVLEEALVRGRGRFSTR